MERASIAPQKRIRDTGMSPCLTYELTMLSCQSSESMREEKYHVGLADSAERVERKEVTNLRTNQNWCIHFAYLLV